MSPFTARRPWRLLAGCAVALTLLTAAVGDVALAQTDAQSFGSDPAPTPVADGAAGMLQVCDKKLTECEQDATGVGFLAAAYLALWVILVIFFFVVRARQARLVAEMRELRARLRVLTEGGAAADGAER